MKAKIFVLLLFSLSLLSCDPYILRVAIDSNGFEKSFNFECGKIDVFGNVLADRQVSTFLNFKLNSSIVVNPEKLEIVHKGEKITANVYLKSGLIKEEKTINTDDEVRVMVNRVVRVGDTITVNIDNFILCEDKPLDIGNISLILVQR